MVIIRKHCLRAILEMRGWETTWTSRKKMAKDETRWAGCAAGGGEILREHGGWFWWNKLHSSDDFSISFATGNRRVRLNAIDVYRIAWILRRQFSCGARRLADLTSTRLSLSFSLFLSLYVSASLCSTPLPAFSNVTWTNSAAAGSNWNLEDSIVW